jgi:hypothetical protein
VVGAIVRKPEALPANPRRRLLQSFAMAASGATGLGSPLSLARTFMI